MTKVALSGLSFTTKDWLKTKKRFLPTECYILFLAHMVKNLYKQYTILEEIGRGGFGIVYKAIRRSDGAAVAIKFIDHRHVRKWTVVSFQLSS